MVILGKPFRGYQACETESFVRKLAAHRSAHIALEDAG